MKEASAPGPYTCSRGAMKPSADVSPKGTSPRFFPCPLQKPVPTRPPELGIPGRTDGSVRYAVNWVEIEDLFKSKYTHNLTDRHAAAVIKVCHRYLAHYNGIPYADLPDLTPVVRHLVRGFQQGKSEYGLALRKLCTVASKPFVARKVSEPLTYKDAVVLFVVTLCEAAAYEYGDQAAASPGADATREDAAAALHDIPSQNEIPRTAALQNDAQECVAGSPKCDTMPTASDRAYSADDVKTISSSSSFTASDGGVMKSADICEKHIRLGNHHAGLVNRHTPSSEECSLKSIESGSRSPTHILRTTAGSIEVVGSELHCSAATTFDEGNFDSATAGSAVPAEPVCEGSKATARVSNDEDQRKEETGSIVTDQPPGGRLPEAKQNEAGAQIEAVRSAVFDFLRALASQRRTLRHTSSKSDTKECKIGSSPTAMTHPAYWPFELPAFLPVLNLVKTAFLLSRATPVIHTSVMHLLLDLSGYKPVAAYLVENRLLIGLLREAHFDALAAAGFPSGAAYTEFRGMAIETVLNLVECTVRENMSHITCMTDTEASAMVNNLRSLLQELYAPRSPFQILHLRNDLLCTVMLLSNHKRLLPLFASSSLLQKLIDNSCDIEILHCASDIATEAFSDGVPNNVQACEVEPRSNRAKYSEHSCMRDTTPEGDSVQAGDSRQLPTQVVPVEFQDVESLGLCWMTIVNCLDDSTCKGIIQNSRFLRTLLDFIKTELNSKDVTGNMTNRSRMKGVRHRALFMQAVSLLSPALEHLAEAFVDLGGLQLLLHIMKEQLFPDLVDNFLQLLAHICLVSDVAMQARALLLADNGRSAVETLISCMEGVASARIPLPAESLTPGLPAESKSDFLKSHHFAALLLAALCCDSDTAREQFRQLSGPSAVVKHLETALASMRCVRSWTSIAYVFCLSECIWTTATLDAATTKDYISAGGVRLILEALKRSPKLLQRHLLGCLTELLRDEEAVQICREWRAADTGESAMELLISLWERDQQKFAELSQDGCIVDTRRPLNSPEMKDNGPPRRGMSSNGRFSASMSVVSQPSECLRLIPQIPSQETVKTDANDSISGHQTSSQNCCPDKREGSRRRESRMSLHQALLLAASSRRPEDVCSHLSNNLEKTVFSYECQDIRLDVFCAIESLTRGFCDLHCQLTTEQKQQVELMKVYPRCCQLEMWEDVKHNLEAKGVQPTDVDLRWMETEIHELHSISLRLKEAQQAILQRACSEENEAANDFYNQILFKTTVAKP